MAAKASTPSPFWRRLWLDVKALALPLGGYWASVVLGLGLFTGCVVLFSKADDPGVTAGLIGGFWLGTFGGLLAGQLMALLRLRSVWVLGGALALWAALAFAMASSAVAATQLDALAPAWIALLIALFILPMFLATGHWSLSTHTGMLATFGPLMWFTAAILVTANNTGGADAWFAGDKWAIWSVFTVPILGAGVVLVLVYLAGRELHRLHAWRFSPLGPDLPEGATTTVGLRSAGCGSLVVLLILAIPLTVGTALVAPYFFRSHESDEGRPRDGGGVSGQDPADQQPSPTTPTDGTQQVQQLQQAASEAARALITLLMLLLFALLAILVFGLPLRRMLLLQYLRTPFWPVAPSRRVAQHWRLVEIALADADLHRQPGDSATALARRANAEVPLLDPESLQRAAEVADRVAYGLGIAHDDVMVARRAAEMTYQSVWDDLSEWARWKAMYRLL